LHARAYLAKAALLLGLPIVDGGFSGANLGMTAYPASEEPTESPCWRCGGEPVPGTFSCRQFAEHAGAAGVIPAIQNGAAALGGLCAEAVVMMLHDKIEAPRRVSFDLRTGESLVFEPGSSPECAPHHRRLPAPVLSDLGGEATAAELLGVHGDAAGARLVLPDLFVERAPCMTCLGTSEVGAPTHRWRHDPRCDRCGGPWRWISDANQGQDVIGDLVATDPQATKPLAEFGVGPGDILELIGSDHASTVKVAGDVDLLWEAWDQDTARGANSQLG